ncbi:hypothetical protein ACHAXS_004653, partial [Conticribra weissflogii]
DSSSPDKLSKKKLKSQLKFLRKVQKLETRIRHAISRRDPIVEQSAREELKLLWATREDSACCNEGVPFTVLEKIDQRGSPTPACDPRRDAALEDVVSIFRELLSSVSTKEGDATEKMQHDSFFNSEVGNTFGSVESLESERPADDVLSNFSNMNTPEESESRIKGPKSSFKVKETQKARHLLRHMTKGTQTSSMFRDKMALRGYMRQKFHCRAALVIESLGKMSPDSLSVKSSVIPDLQKNDLGTCWEKLGKVQSVCSIGCGPGNDIVGFIAFLKQFAIKGNFEQNVCLREVHFLDFAIKEWKEAVLDDLIPILSPRYVQNVSCKFCDITTPLMPGISEYTENGEILRIVENTDIFLTSYLLTETRNKWDHFILELVGLAKVGAIFYFAEPMPWQLHRLIRLSTGESDGKLEDVDYSPLNTLRFMWIDSSMYHPALQPLDGRVGGPAVLLCIKT